MPTLSQLILVIVGFWLILTYLASRYDFQKYGLFVSSGLLLWKSSRLKSYLSKPKSPRFKKYEELSSFVTLVIFYALPMVLVLNVFLSFVQGPAPLFEDNPLRVVSVDVFLLIIPALFIVSSVYQLLRGRSQSEDSNSLESSGIFILGVFISFYSRSKEKLTHKNFRTKLRTIGSPVTALLVILLLLYPFSNLAPAMINPAYHPSSGALVVNVITGSPAHEKGLVKGDVITGIQRLDDGTVLPPESILSKIDYHATLRTIEPSNEFFVIVNGDPINVISVRPAENSPNTGGSSIGVDVEDYREPKLSLMSPLFPFYLMTFLTWLINITLIYTLYNVLPFPKGDGELLLKSLLDSITRNPGVYRLAQVMYLGLFLVNFFLD